MQHVLVLRLHAASKQAAFKSVPQSITFALQTHLRAQAQTTLRSGTLPGAVASQKYASTTSAPKESEGPSAEFGGSRSKDAAESASKGSRDSSSTAGIDSLADRDARGRTGGGEPLESTSDNAPPKPKITNASVPGKGQNKLTDEQQREVDEHNRQFEKRYDRAGEASKDKVHDDFWRGGGTVSEPGTK